MAKETGGASTGKSGTFFSSGTSRSTHVSQVSDGPDDRHEDEAAAHDVHHVEDVPPLEPHRRARGCLLQDDLRHVVKHLPQRGSSGETAVKEQSRTAEIDGNTAVLSRAHRTLVALRRTNQQSNANPETATTKRKRHTRTRARRSVVVRSHPRRAAHLERQDDHDDALVPAVQEGLDQRPAGPDEQHDHEQGDALKEREEVVDDAPGLRGAGQAEVVVPDGLEQHGEGLEHQENRHHVVDMIHLRISEGNAGSFGWATKASSKLRAT